MKNFRVIVITGGSAGIGRALATEFATSAKVKIALLAREGDRLEKARSELEKLGAEVRIFSVDVANWQEVYAAAESIEAGLGPIDLWINNATTSVVGRIVDIEPKEFQRVIDVTYMGYVHGTKAALKYMLPRNRGRIIQVSSGLAYRSIPLQSAYCAAKHAIVGFTESLVTELKREKSKVSVTMVHLPAVNTPQFDWTRNHVNGRFRPMSPVYSPEFIAQGIHWAAQQNRREVFVGGMTAFGAYINKVAPSIADWYLSRTAFSAQIESKPAREKDNLFVPVRGNYAARGSFTNEEKNRSYQFAVSKKRNWILLGAGLLSAATFLMNSKPRRSLYV